MRSDRFTVGITGASGWIGRQVCAWLQAQGVRVVAIVRRPVLLPGAESCVADLAGFAAPSAELVRSLSACDALIHCAAHVHRPLETPREKVYFHKVNAEGTRNVVRACLDCGVERIVYTSTIACYEWTAVGDGGVLEDGPIDPGSIYAATKLQGEQTLRDSGADWRILRLATVFGEGDRANFARLAEAQARRRFLLPGSGEARKSVIPLPLAAELIGRMALLENPRYRLVNTALPIAPSLGEICAAFSTVCGFPGAVQMPRRLLWWIARAGDVMASALGSFPLTSGTVNRLTTTTVVRTNRLQELFPQVAWPSFAEALTECQAYYRAFARGGIVRGPAGSGPQGQVTPIGETSVPRPPGAKATDAARVDHRGATAS